MNHFIGRNHAIVPGRDIHHPRPLSRRHLEVSLSRLAIGRLLLLQILFHDIHTLFRVVLLQVRQCEEDAMTPHDFSCSVELSLCVLR